MNTKEIKERFGAQLENWKKEYGKVFGYKSTDGKIGVFRTPDLTILDLCQAIAKGSSIQYDKALVENCWLGGDECLKNETKYFLGMRSFLGDIVEVVSGELGEL